jgi:hypothetical protein
MQQPASRQGEKEGRSADSVVQIVLSLTVNVSSTSRFGLLRSRCTIGGSAE